MRNKYLNWSADRTVCFWLLVWLVVNLLQAAFTGMADDEPYYLLYAQHLDWGYFDHPPVTALLVWLGKFVGGGFGIRLFFVLLQPLYLYLFWTLLRPAGASRREGELYVLICSSILMLQLYGFIAVPDAPLMMSVALFLWAYKRFTERDTWLNTILLAVTMALMAYSKYQGALVVLFAFAANPRLLLKGKVWLAGLLTLVLYAPHLYWQYANDFPSFRYHLVGRNRTFRFSYLTEYLLNMIACFNPFYVPLVCIGWRTKATSATPPLRRALLWIVGGFLVFFFFSGFRGHVQPQWLIPICYGVVMTVFGCALSNERVAKYVRVVSIVTVSLVALARIEMIFNPIGIKYQIFDNKESYGRVAAIAKGRPMLYRWKYDFAAKYRFYTGGECFSQPDIDNRTSEWQYTNYDDRFAGRQTVVEVESYDRDAQPTDSVVLANGKSLYWTVVDNYVPVRRVTVEPSRLPRTMVRGKRLTFDLTIANPYRYDVLLGAGGKRVQLVVKVKGEKRFHRYNLPVGQLVSAGLTVHIDDIEYVVPPDLPKGSATVGFVIDNSPAGSWFAGKVHKIEIE